MKKWLFGFQKSVALVLTHILDARNRALLNAKVQTSRMSLDRPEEYGHGNYDNIEMRHGNQTSTVNGSRAFSTEIGSGGGAPRVAQSLAVDSMFDSFQRWNLDRDSSNDASPTIRRVRSPLSEREQAKIIAISPAIPIMSTSLPSDEEEYRERVASSYRDQDVGLSPLEIMRNRSRSHGSDYDEDDDEEPDHITVSTQDESADEGVFEMDGLDDDDDQPAPRSRTASDHNKSNSNKRSSPLAADSVESSPRSSFSSRGSADSSKAKKTKGLRWRSGHCTKLGQRERNEDRFVVAPNIHERNYATEEATWVKTKLANSHHHPAPGSSYSGLARGLMSQSATLEHCKHQFGGGNEKSCGYFAVYDGHCGDSASVYLEQKLLDKILR
jgi:hypothetical protein